MEQLGTAHVVIDGQWGSTGKGKAAAEIAANHVHPVAIHADFQPNAGHTIVLDGKPLITSVIPSSAAVCPEARVLLGPTSCIEPAQLQKEIDMFEEIGIPVRDRLVISPRAGILYPSHAETEKKTTYRIASTMKGTGAALSEKIMRTASLADSPGALPWIDKKQIADTSELLHAYLSGGNDVLLETAQGFDLSLNHGWRYPYVTSRDITPAVTLGTAGLPASIPHRVWGILRTYPIRVGDFNKSDDEVYSSGPFYPDQVETTWDHIAERSGYPSLIEKTTVTQRVRRVFTFSKIQLARFLQVCAPDYLYMNFANYWDSRIEGMSNIDELSTDVFDTVVQEEIANPLSEIDSFIENAYVSSNCPYSHVPRIVALGTGPGHNESVWMSKPNDWKTGR